jgi:hypothetical protein
MTQYNEHLKKTASLFDVTKLTANYKQRAAVLRAHISTDSSEAEFDAGVQALIQATQSRADALKAYLATL